MPGSTDVNGTETTKDTKSTKAKRTAHPRFFVPFVRFVVHRLSEHNASA
jgi:hypothetical protein